jgi:ketosteroid isomerase-like protein
MFGIASLLFTVLISAPSHAPSTDAPALKQQISALLGKYAHKDVAGIMAMLDDGPVLFMGTDLSEVEPSRDGIKRLLNSDFKRWDSSRFGTYKDFFVRSSGDMATAFFDVPWEAKTKGSSHTFDIRLATVWHRTAHGWRLMQLLNAAPST